MAKELQELLLLDDSAVWAEGTEPDFALPQSSQSPDVGGPDLDFYLDMDEGAARGIPLASCSVSSATQSLSERIRLYRAVATVQTTFFSRWDDTHPHQDLLDQVDHSLRQVERLELGTRTWRKEQRHLEQLAEELRAQLTHLEHRISHRWLRGLFLLAPIEDEIIASYLRFAINNYQGHDRNERIILIAVKTASYPIGNGTLKLRRVAKVEQIWRDLLPDSGTTAEQVERGALFFRRAKRELEQFSSGTNLFSSRFYRDVIGYIASLRDQLLCPPLLFACCDFYIQLLNWIERNASAASATGAIDRDFEHSLERVAQVLGPSPRVDDIAEADFFARFLQACRRARVDRSPRLDRSQSCQGHKGNRLRQALLVAVLGALAISAAPLVEEALATGERKSRTVPQPQAQKLHPIFLSATAGDSATLIVAQVDKEEWNSLSVQQRRDLASSIADAMRTQGPANLTAHADETIVLEIADYQVMHVDATEAAP